MTETVQSRKAPPRPSIAPATFTDRRRLHPSRELRAYITNPIFPSRRLDYLLNDKPNSRPKATFPSPISLTRLADAIRFKSIEAHATELPMNRRAFLKALGSAALLPLLPLRLFAANPNFRRRHPADPAWPSPSAWKQLNDAVGGNLLPVNFPLSQLKTDPESAAAKLLWKNLKNPYYLGDQPGLTQTLGWIDAWATQPSFYAIAARNAHDIAEAVNFAREK